VQFSQISLMNTTVYVAAFVAHPRT
jgi:hypothetical protein